ncbi:MAG: YggT family protein [Oligoflexia bacterium]|nr:YggT family protein [Oligoflexia bacterium]
MVILANLLRGIATVLDMLLGMVIFLVIARAIISWVNADPMNPIVRFLVSSTDPLLRPLRRFVPILGGGIDITPIVLLLLLYFLKAALVDTLMDYAHFLRITALQGAALLHEFASMLA